MRAELLAIGLSIFYVMVVTWVRGWIQRARTGSNGINGFGGAGRTQALAGLVQFLAGGAVGVLAPVLALLGVVEPIAALDSGAIVATGCVLYLMGLAALFYVQLAMGDSWRIGVEPTERTDLVTTGPFALARNPIYTTMIVLTAGLVLIVPSWVAFAGLVALLASLEVTVRLVEEPYLAGVHGASYRAYAARVGRFMPWLGRLGEPARAAR